jgi:hypothetical protein
MSAAQAALVDAREQFEDAVRRLARAGASMEEVVDALGISRESANRILGGKGTDLLTCSFCRRSQRVVGKLIAGPAVYICDRCVGLAAESARTQRESKDQSAQIVFIPRTSDEHSCSFCGKERAHVDSFVSSQTGETICNECLELCGEIMTEEPA